MYNKEQINYLNRPIGEDPCLGCCIKGKCRSCPTGKEYQEKIKPYKDLQIYELSKKIATAQQLSKKVTAMNKEITNDLLKNGCKINRFDADKPTYVISSLTAEEVL